MKKKVITFVSICIVTVSSYLIFNQSSQIEKVLHLTLARIESLANNELGDSHSWLQPKTVNCVLHVGGGMVTGSVERICEFCAVPYSCTAVPCGETFYN